jgi:D-alanine--poly(phosphoribitol) ligase subunit 1
MLIFLQTTKALEKGSMPSLKKVIFGGEGYPKTKLKELHAAIGKHARLINVYGPTECTCICSTYDVTPADFEDLDGYPPIGRLTATFSRVLLDGDRAVAPGEVGELCLGGPMVGHGYFNQPELTKKAFLQNPLNSAYEERLYRTGDLMRLDLKDGKLWFVGRKDFQIKHQGFRIELEEIQHALAQSAGVEEAAVIQVFESSASLLVAFVATKQPLSPEQLRKDAAKLVPKYMVPGKVLLLERLPKNPNGKTDRKQLQALYQGNGARKETV